MLRCLKKLFIVYYTRTRIPFITTGVSLSSKAHGPALTLKITRPTAKSHDISVDIVISLPTADELTSFGWPLKATRRALTAQKIEDVKAAGLHLVPKSADVFDISFSKAERAILTGIDSGNGCRKMCHKVIKKYIESYRSHNPAEGISSHIFKVRYKVFCMFGFRWSLETIDMICKISLFLF